MTVRASQPEDAPAIAAIESIASPSPWSLDAIEAQLGSALDASWVAQSSRGIVGHLLTRVVAGEAEVLTLVVHPDAQRQGHARRLMQRAAQRWEQRGVRLAFLEVRQRNAAARALYLGMGWTETGVRPRYYSDGQDAVLMQVTLC